MDWTALGMPLEDPPDDLAQPLETALVVKGLSNDGQIAYWIMGSGGLQAVEVLGMFTWGAHVALNADADSE